MRFKDSFRALRNILTLALEMQNTFTHTLPVRGHYLLTHFWTDKVTLTVESGAFS